MPVKLSEVKGLMVNKSTHKKYYPWADGYNDLIDHQGSRSIGLNREKLARRIFIKNTKCPNDWKEQVDMFKQPRLRAIIFAYELADDFIANEKYLIEFKESK